MPSILRQTRSAHGMKMYEPLIAEAEATPAERTEAMIDHHCPRCESRDGVFKPQWGKCSQCGFSY